MALKRKKNRSDLIGNRIKKKNQKNRLNRIFKICFFFIFPLKVKKRRKGKNSCLSYGMKRSEIKRE